MKKVVLIVDDEDMVRESVIDCIGDEFSTLEAKNPLEALNIIEKSNPHLVVTDFNMPLMDGKEFVKMLRDLKKEFPILFLTGRGSVDLHKDVWIRGVYDYIEKPFDPNQLKKTVRSAIELSQRFSNEVGFRNLLGKQVVELNIEVSNGTFANLKDCAEIQGCSISTVIENLLKKSS